MKMRRNFMVLVMGGLLAALPASAQTLADKIAGQLTQQGFADIGIEDTWLGRTRITANRNGGSREIIINPNTGEILRDLWLNSKGQLRAADIDLDDYDDVDDDDDETDDDADDDSDDDGGQGRGRGRGRGGDSDGDSDSDSDSDDD